MVRVITQETFDEAVKENMDAFDLSQEEALTETIEQFQSQGVDLSNIVTQGTSDKLAKAVASLTSKLNKDELELVRDHLQMGVAERVRATELGLAETLIKALDAEDAQEYRVEVVNTLSALLEGNPDPITNEGIQKIITLLASSSSSTSLSSAQLVPATLRCVLNSLVKHEQNRQSFVSLGLLNHLDQAIVFLEEKGHVVLVAKVWQALVQDDDIRVQFGKAHETARAIVEEHKALSQLVFALDKASEPTAQIALLSCLNSLTVRNEYCQSVVDEGGLKLVLALLLEPDQNRDVVKECLKVIKTLAGNDSVKLDVAKSQGINVIVNAMNKHLAIKPICLSGCGALTALCLRNTSNAQQTMEAGGAQLLVQVLKVHNEQPKLVVASCNAIRNIVSRSRHLCKEFVNLEVEPLLREAKNRHGKNVEDAIKAVLRDLGLRVELKEEWTGSNTTPSVSNE